MIARSRSSSLLSARTVSFKVLGSPVPALVEAADQARAKPRQRDVGVDLLQADLDVPPADPPAAGDVVGIVRPGQQLADPLHESALEPVDLGLPARDDLARCRVALDLGVEVVDKVMEIRLQQRGGGRRSARRRRRSSPRTTAARDNGRTTGPSPFGPSHRHKVNKKTHAPPSGGCVGTRNPAGRPVREQSGLLVFNSTLGETRDGKWVPRRLDI